MPGSVATAVKSRSSTKRARPLPIPKSAKSKRKARPLPLPHHPAAAIEEDPGPHAGMSVAIAGFGDEDDQYWQNVYKQLLESSAALFGRDIMGVEIGDHLEEWSELVNKNSRLAIQAARDHSKCSTGDALIIAANGERIRTDQWKGGMVVAFDKETQKFCKAYSPPSEPNGVRHALRVTTRTGRKITVTDNHPFRLFDKWEQADRLQPKDRIAVPYSIKLDVRKEVPGAWLLGLLVGDGALKGSGVRVTIADDLTLKALRCEVAAMGWEVSGPQGKYGYGIHKNYSHDGPVKWLKKQALMGKGSYEKRVPTVIFKSSNKSIAKFLAGYLDADGCVNQRGGGAITYTSVSEELLRDAQHLLLRLGIVSVLGKKKGKYKGEEHWSWGLIIRGKDALRFANVIPSKGKKKQQLFKLAKAQSKRSACSGNAVDRFPKEVWRYVRNSVYWFEKRQLSRPNKQYEPTREKLCKIAQAENNEELAAFAAGDVLWDEVVSVEDAGQRETWSVCVPGFENYIAADIVNHNSTFFSYVCPVWWAWKEPGVEIYIFSKTQEQAQEFIDTILWGRNNLKGIADIPALSHLVPDQDGVRDPRKRTRLNRSDVILTNGSRIRAVGYGKAIRGRHPKYVVLDDPLNDEDMWSETVRQKNIAYFQSAIVNMVMPSEQYEDHFEGGQCIVVGTPYHMADLFGWLEKNEVYKFYRYPGIIKENGTERALFPWRWTLKQLYNKKKEIGSVAFSREILCLAINDDISIFPTYLFPPLFDELMTLRPTKEMIAQRGWTIYQGIDIARSASVGADFFVIYTLGKDRAGTRYLVDMHRSKGLSFRKQLEQIGIEAAKYDPSLIFIEANVMQQIYTGEMRRMTDLPVKEFTTLAVNKYPLDKGVPGLRIVLENEKFVIPRGDEYSRVISDMWMSECSQFGWVDGKLQGIGSHDDTVMAWWFAEEAAKAAGFSFAFDDDDGNDALDKENEESDDAYMDVLIGPPEERGDNSEINLF